MSVNTDPRGHVRDIASGISDIKYGVDSLVEIIENMESEASDLRGRIRELEAIIAQKDELTESMLADAVADARWDK